MRFEVSGQPLSAANKTNYQICTTMSESYLPHGTVMLVSMLEKIKKDKPCNLFILTSDISQENQARLKGDLSPYDVHLFFITPIFDGIDLDAKLINKHFKKETFFRLAIPALLCDMKSRVLYLDPDMVVLDDISLVFDYKLSSKKSFMAACLDLGLFTHIRTNEKNALGMGMAEYHTTILRIPSDRRFKYSQAGVILFDLSEIDGALISDRLLDFISNNELPLADQDAINSIYGENISELPLQWNLSCGIFYPDNLSGLTRPEIEAVQAALLAPKIIHYAGGDKPWKSLMMPFSNVYWEYAKKTSWYEATVSAWISDSFADSTLSIKNYLSKKDHLAALAAGKDWLEEKWKSATARITDLDANIAEITSGKNWIEAQWKSAKVHNQELIHGKAWLEAEWKAAKAHNEELTQGKAWLEAEWKAAKAHNEELTQGKAWLEAEWKAATQIIAERDAALGALTQKCAKEVAAHTAYRTDADPKLAQYTQIRSTLVGRLLFRLALAAGKPPVSQPTSFSHT